MLLIHSGSHLCIKIQLIFLGHRNNSYCGFNDVHWASGSKFGEEYSELKAASFFLLLLLVMLWLPLISLWSCLLHSFESTEVWSDGVPWSCLLRTVSLVPRMDPLIPTLPHHSHPITVAGSRASFQEQRNCFLLEEPLREAQKPPFPEPWTKAPLMVSTSSLGPNHYLHGLPSNSTRLLSERRILNQRTL